MTLRSCWLLALALASAGFAVQPAAAQLEVVRSRATNRIIYVKVHPGQSAAPRLAAAEPVAEARRFLSDNKALLSIQDPVAELVAGASKRDPQGMTHITFHQTYHGIPVVGGEVLVHVSRDGAVASAGNKFASGLALDPKPVLSAEQAVAAATAAWRRDFRTNVCPQIHEKSLVVLPLSLIDNSPIGSAHLAWEVGVVSEDTPPLSNDLYYVDARTGEILKTFTRIIQLSRLVKDCSAYSLGYPCLFDDPVQEYPGYLFGRSESEPARGPNPFPNPPSIYGGSLDVDNLYDFLGLVHSYWNTKFGRNGANNAGGLGDGQTPWGVPLSQTRGYAHTDDWWPTMGHCNAGFTNYSPSFVIFSVGMVVTDVVGHEYSHAIPFFSFHDLNGRPIGPVYSGEAGALNESWADLEGDAFELFYSGHHDWTAGTSFTEFGDPAVACCGPLRDMSDPQRLTELRDGERLSYPDRFYSPSVYCGTADNSGVHHNSTIPSYAMYLLSVGGNFNGCHINGIGEEAAERIFYQAWQYQFNRTETFNEAYVDLIEASDALYASTHPEYTNELTKALQAVEMDQAGACVDSTGALWHAPDCATPAAVGPDGGTGRGDRGVRLLGVAPNPFTPRTVIRWAVANSVPVDVAIYDLGGKLVRHLRSGPCTAGNYELAWDGATDAGQRVASGVFFVRVSGGGGWDSRKIMRLR